MNGMMYVTDPRGSVYALDAATGHYLWEYDVTEFLGGAPFIRLAGRSFLR